MSSFVTRFAPSPTGFLHLGHAASAFAVWDWAHSADGSVILRIEDIDLNRCRPEFEAAIFEDLAWLGLVWPAPVRRQSEHFSEYERVIDILHQRGLAYRCFRTRQEVAAQSDRAPHAPEPVFRGAPLPAYEEKRRLETGQAHAWRLSISAARDWLGPRASHLCYIETSGGSQRQIDIDPDTLSDIVIGRKDSPASYHLAACHDDALQGVSHVIRGDDLAPSTPVHILLQALMGWPQPVYCHHRLLLDADGKRFAKRNKSVTLRDLRATGVTPEQIRRMTAAQ